MNVLDPDELGPVAERLLFLAEAQASLLPSSDLEPQSSSTIADSVLAEVAAHELHRRAKRSHHLPAALFDEAGWDILLALFVSEQNGRPMSLKSACIASQVAPTTAIRYIAFMVADGLVRRSEGPAGMRNKVLNLTAKGLAATRAALQEYAREAVE